MSDTCDALFPGSADARCFLLPNHAGSHKARGRGLIIELGWNDKDKPTDDHSLLWRLAAHHGVRADDYPALLAMLDMMDELDAMPEPVSTLVKRDNPNGANE